MEEKIYSISLAGGQRFVLVINDHHPPWHCPPWHCPSWHCPPWHCPPWHQYHPLGAQVSCGRGGGGHCRWPCSWLGIVVSFPITLICLSINDTICHHPYMIVIETILIVITQRRYISTCIGPILEPTPSLSQTTRCRFEQQLMMSKLFYHKQCATKWIQIMVMLMEMLMNPNWNAGDEFQHGNALHQGGQRATLVSDSLEEPRAITLHPGKGSVAAFFRIALITVIIRWMFWSDWGREPKIERAGMDGSHRWLAWMLG